MTQLNKRIFNKLSGKIIFIVNISPNIEDELYSIDTLKYTK
jgi:hypothetical protein